MFITEEAYMDQEIDDFLEHYGIKGMKWGIRNSYKKTGVSRFRSAQTDINNRSLLYLQRSRQSGNSVMKGLRFARAMYNSPRMTLNNKEMVSRLKEQNKRLKKGGHPTSQDMLQMHGEMALSLLGLWALPGRITVPQLVISNRPKKPV